VGSESECRHGAGASALPGATLPGLPERKAFRNFLSHGLATVVPWSVSAFLLDKLSADPRSFREVSANSMPTRMSLTRKPEEPRSLSLVHSQSRSSQTVSIS